MSEGPASASTEPASPAGDPLPAEFQRLVDCAEPPGRWLLRESLTNLLALGIASYAELAAALPSLHGDALVIAVRALPCSDKRRATPLLLEVLRRRDACVRVDALRALRELESARSVQAFVRHLREDPDPDVREQAAYGLSFLCHLRYEELVFESLLAALGKEDECPRVRAQAAEGLGYIFSYADRRTRRFKRAQAALIRALDHPAPEIRFWACFAVGSIRSRAAVAKLTHMVESDRVVCPGWWPVGDEASDALQHILTGGWPLHERERQVGADVSSPAGCAPASATE